MGLKERGRERERTVRSDQLNTMRERAIGTLRERERELTIPLFTLLVYSFWQYTET